MVDEAHADERRDVAPEVAGSNPVIHPMRSWSSVGIGRTGL